MLVYDMDTNTWVIPLGWLLPHSQTDVTGKLIPRPLPSYKVPTYFPLSKCCLLYTSDAADDIGQV